MSVIRSYNLNQTEAITDAPAQIIRVFDSGVLVVNAEAGTVTSVNGLTGAVVLGASDVDADPTGSADTAQTTAEAYTDAQIAAEVTRADAAYDAAGAAAAAQTASEAYTDAAIDALPASGAVDSVNGQTGAVTLDYTDVGADPAGAADDAQAAAIAADPVPSDGLPRSLGTSDPGVGVAFSRWDHIHPMPSSSDIGAATAAQGALADTAVQRADLATVATTGAYSDLSGTPTIPDSADDIGAVPTTRTVAGHALSADVTISAADVSAVPTTRTVNAKALSADITLSASDVSAVPTTRTVNGHALSGDVTVTAADVATVSINAQTGTTYTAVSGDKGKLVTMTNASANTLTIPASVFSAGDMLHIQQRGTGQTTIAQGSGMTLDSDPGLKIAARYGAATVVFLSASTATVIGRLSA